MRKVILWEEPNRANTPPLHIASRGDRYSSLTGVWWLDGDRFVVNHRSGLRLAMFDLRQGDEPVFITSIPHLTDDVAAFSIGGEKWDVAVSGCWASSYSRYSLSNKGFDLLETKSESRWPRFISKFLRKTFCHGVTYSKEGHLIVTYHTGANPRICNVTTKKEWTLPTPWGARDACYDGDGNLYVVANTANPARRAYTETSAAVWKLDDNSFELVAESIGAHFDACAIYNGLLYANNQHDDCVSVFDLKSGKELEPLNDSEYCFPHGIAISPTGILAVTNYGTSTVVLRSLV